MTKVKLLSARVGHAYDGKNITKENPHGRFTGVFSQAAGSVVSMPDDEAQRYLDAGLAEPAPKDTK
jgi:hypothetical protein